MGFAFAKNRYFEDFVVDCEFLIRSEIKDGRVHIAEIFSKKLSDFVEDRYSGAFEVVSFKSFVKFGIQDGRQNKTGNLRKISISSMQLVRKRRTGYHRDTSKLRILYGAMFLIYTSIVLKFDRGQKNESVFKYEYQYGEPRMAVINFVHRFPEKLVL